MNTLIAVVEITEQIWRCEAMWNAAGRHLKPKFRSTVQASDVQAKIVIMLNYS
jgi:hypothetical protein